jgi:adenine-specific DNA-methyltransferase
MPMLNWLGKDAVVDHHRRVPLRGLVEVPELAIPGDGPGHTLIEGDNLDALKALLPQYRGRVDCIYIDPPYNTGNEGWVYNDNVNSPAMRDWLKKEVGRDDLSRHDKWLCMMYPRLVLMRELLHEEGSIWIHIDNYELGYLILLLDEIFGGENRKNIIAWQKKYAAANDDRGIASVHEHVLCYTKSRSWSPLALPRSDKSNAMYKFKDSQGVFRTGDYTCNKNSKERPTLFYPITNPNTGKKILPNPSRVWAFSPETHAYNELNKLVWWGSDGTAEKPQFKRYLQNLRNDGGQVPPSLWLYEEVGHTDEARKELRGILGTDNASDFATPKPVRLATRVLQIALKDKGLVVDAFAGSGTTGQAVMQLNRADGGQRRCILIQQPHERADGPNLAQDITRERLARVSAGYRTAKGEEVAGLGQSWRYCRLGRPCFSGAGEPRHDLTWDELVPLVFLHATGESFAGAIPHRAFLGAGRDGTGVYLLYNGDMDDKDGRSRNVLTLATLARLHPHPGPRLVYGAACRVGAEELQAARITFRQYPQALAGLGL